MSSLNPFVAYQVLSCSVLGVEKLFMQSDITTTTKRMPVFTKSTIEHLTTIVFAMDSNYLAFAFALLYLVVTKKGQLYGFLHCASFELNSLHGKRSTCFVLHRNASIIFFASPRCFSNLVKKHKQSISRISQAHDRFLIHKISNEYSITNQYIYLYLSSPNRNSCKAGKFSNLGKKVEHPSTYHSRTQS